MGILLFWTMFSCFICIVFSHYFVCLISSDVMTVSFAWRTEVSFDFIYSANCSVEYEIHTVTLWQSDKHQNLEFCYLIQHNTCYSAKSFKYLATVTPESCLLDLNHDTRSKRAEFFEWKTSFTRVLSFFVKLWAASTTLCY